MILYFSGTGNSKYVAQKIGNITGDQVISMNERLKQGNTEPLRSDTPFVFVCPTYAWRMPRIVEDYISKVTFSGTKKDIFHFNLRHPYPQCRSLYRKTLSEQRL